jgi:SET domain-containing protein
VSGGNAHNPAVPRAPASQPFQVRPSPIAGRGVFATRRIPAGTRLIEYVGERISSDEADRRYDDDSMPEHHTLLFAVDDETVIDAATGGNDARFFNHACKPNCQAVNEDGRIFVYTLVDITPGTELVYDYSLSRDEPWDERFRDLYVCRCGAPRCRGIILRSPKPPAARKRAPAKTGAKKTARKAAKKAAKTAKR